MLSSVECCVDVVNEWNSSFRNLQYTTKWQSANINDVHFNDKRAKWKLKTTTTAKTANSTTHVCCIWKKSAERNSKREKKSAYNAMLFHSCLHETKRKSNTHTKCLKSIKCISKWLLFLCHFNTVNSNNHKKERKTIAVVLFFFFFCASGHSCGVCCCCCCCRYCFCCVLPQMESSKEQQMIKLCARLNAFDGGNCL